MTSWPRMQPEQAHLGGLRDRLRPRVRLGGRRGPAEVLRVAEAEQRAEPDRDHDERDQRPVGRPDGTDLRQLGAERAAESCPPPRGRRRRGMGQVGARGAPADRNCCRHLRPPLPPKRAEVRAHPGRRAGPARNCTLDAVSSMNACSSDACAGASSCSRTALSNARSPTWLTFRPRTTIRPSPSSCAVAPGRGDRPAQRVRLRRADPDRLRGVGRDELGHRAVRDQLAPADHQQVVGGVLHLRHQVAGDEDRAALGRERLHQVADPQDALGIQPVDRLVEHEDRRVAEQRGGDPEPLPHAQREALGPLARDLAQADQREHLVHPPPGQVVGLRPGRADGCRRCGRRAPPSRPAAPRPPASGARARANGWPLTVTVPPVG